MREGRNALASRVPAIPSELLAALGGDAQKTRLKVRAELSRVVQQAAGIIMLANDAVDKSHVDARLAEQESSMGLKLVDPWGSRYEVILDYLPDHWLVGRSRGPDKVASDDDIYFVEYWR